MVIKRDHYVNQVIAKRWNGKVKIITGLRRCGKSYLLSELYKGVLLSEGVSESDIIELSLEKKSNAKYRNPIALQDYILSKASDPARKYYVFIDEIQLCLSVKNPDIDESIVTDKNDPSLNITFYDVLNDLKDYKNLDIYVTGSNSRMLSSDIVTNFRDRGSEIKVYPLSFREFYNAFEMEKTDALEEYIQHGGMPLAVTEPDEAEKRKYLKDLHKKVYLQDIVERYKLNDDVILEALLDELYSSIGSLSNMKNLSNAVSSNLQKNTSDHTVKLYVDYLMDAYLLSKVARYDVKGKKYFEYPNKYYATDIGLRNAELNFRQIERSHIIENIIYNELIFRGYSVDVGVVAINKVVDGKKTQSLHEIDFVVNKGSQKVYIQSALELGNPEKKEQELTSLYHAKDFFRKIVILGGNQKATTDETGITYVGVIPFLLDESFLDRYM